MYGSRRRAFAMIMAIVILVLVATGGAILLQNVSRTTKIVGNNYLRSQAELLADSATEFAIMRVQGFDTSGGHCLENLDINVTDANNNVMFDANVTIHYSFNGTAPAQCTNVLATNTAQGTLMLIDTTITTNPTLQNDGTLEPITVHKRSWQVL